MDNNSLPFGATLKEIEKPVGASISQDSVETLK
jgi:hypothetical protein